MSNTVYLSEQRMYLDGDDGEPAIYHGYTLSTSYDMHSLEWFHTKYARELFEICVAKCILESRAAPSKSAVRLAAAFLLLTEVDGVEYQDDFLEQEGILIADVRWRELLNAIENLSESQQQMSPEELGRTLLLQYQDDYIHQALFVELVDECVELAIRRGYVVHNSVIGFNESQEQFIRMLRDVVLEHSCAKRGALLREPCFTAKFGPRLSKLFTRIGWEAIDALMTDLEAIRVNVLAHQRDLHDL